jgi:hypothetical protein
MQHRLEERLKGSLALLLGLGLTVSNAQQTGNTLLLVKSSDKGWECLEFRFVYTSKVRGSVRDCQEVGLAIVTLDKISKVLRQ